MRKIATLLILCFMPICLFAQTYKMYQTRNYHNQLRLNTATGEVLQVQDDGQSWKICDAVEDGGEIDNRFCLYETQNMWTFIMLDTLRVRIGRFNLVPKELITCLLHQLIIGQKHILPLLTDGKEDSKCLLLKICGHLLCWIVSLEDFGKCNTTPSL